MKARSPQDEQILAMAEPVAEALGLEIVRVRVQGGRNKTLQIMAERQDGTMTVGACARLSRGLNALLEEADPIAEEYTLEVSSPGIDRPLTTLAHFARWEGFEAKVELDRLVEGRKRFRGELAGTEDDHVLIVLDGEEEAAVLPFAWIIDAKLVMTDALMAESLKGLKDPALLDDDDEAEDADDTEDTHETE